ncbi:fimbria/pilus outer membrane usher protein, partial [Photobacterium lucens]|uniref:fimbria/pilus outer membrane usher protein n=2 Tax=Photobacterium lucens TaxID=2562949 RepID=UPI00136C5892
VGRRKITLSNNEKKNIILTSDWLTSLKLPINYKKLSKFYDKKTDTYDLNLIKDAKVYFDYSVQSITISLPQYYLLNNTESQQWDYGSPGFLLNYAVNANKSFNRSIQNNENLYGNFNFTSNYDRWVFNARFSAESNNGINSPDLTVSTAIQPLHGDFIAGKSITKSSIIPDFSFYGISLRSNSAMQPQLAQGYAPVISGVLNSNALVTVKQGNYVLYSKNLPAGAYSLNNLSPVSNGDITVTIEENNGKKITQIYPVTTLPTLLREGAINYNFVTGVRSDDSKGMFGLASLDYGFNLGTANFASVIHPKYQSIGSGFTAPIRNFGALSAGFNVSWSHYDSAAFQPHDSKVQQGVSASLQYAKDFGENTNLQLLSYKYTGKGYTDFRDFYPNNIYKNNKKRSRYEAILTQRLGLAYLNLSAWKEDYRDGLSNESGINLSLSGTVNNISIGLNGSYSNIGHDSKEYSTSLNVNIPFNLWDREQIINSSVTYDNNTGVSFNSGASFMPNENIVTSINTNISKENKTASLYTGASFNSMETGFSLSQSNNSTVISANASGSVAGAKGVGLVFSNQQNDTVAIAHIDKMKDIEFNGNARTNAQGNALIPLTNYQENNLTIDTNNVPDNVELLNTNFQFVPTNKAIIVRDFKYLKVNRYLLRIKDKNGKDYPMGTEAISDQGNTVGVIANHGVLLTTLINSTKYITVKGKNNTCKIPLSTLTKGVDNIQNISCN